MIWDFGVVRVTQGYRQCCHSIERIRRVIYFSQKVCVYVAPFRHTESYLSKVADFSYPVYLAPLLGVILLEYHQHFWLQETMAYGDQQRLFEL